MQQKQNHTVTSLTDMLDRVEGVAGDLDTVTVEDVLDVVGRRSFGPLLLFAGLVTAMPLVGDIPGMSATMGLFVVFISAQLFLGREYFWMPRWLLDLDIGSGKLQKGVDWMRRPARKIDALLDARLQRLTEGWGLLAVASICALVGLAMPLMEFVPFSATAAGVTLLAYGLALVFRDGWLVLFAHIVAGGTFTLVALGLL